MKFVSWWRTPRRDYRDEAIEYALSPVLARLRVQHFLNWVSRGLAAGAVLSALFLVVSYVWPWPDVGYWCLGAGTGAVLLALVIGVITCPGIWEAACQVDGAELKERVTTALEMSGMQTEMTSRQRRDALYHLRLFDIEKHFPWRFPRREGQVLAAAALVAVLALVLPNPMQSEVERIKAVRQEIARQEQQVEEIKKELEKKNQAVLAEKRTEAVETLQELQQALQAATEEREALSALGRAEEQLTSLADSKQSGAGAEDLEQLAARLSEQEKARGLAEKLASGDGPAIEKEAEELGQELTTMSPSERQALADSLQEAAEQVASPRLAAALNQAGCGVGGT